MAADTFLLDTHDEVPVVVHRWEPDGEVRGIVNLVHGVAEHAARYAHVAAACNEAGFAVYAEDHRGHGQTARTEEELGFFAEQRGWAKVLDDLHRVTHLARMEHPGVPLFLYGHSLGSYFVQHYLFTFPDEVDGAILSGSRGPRGRIAEAEAIVLRAERLRLGPRGRSKALTAYEFGAYNRAFKPNRTDFDWLSRDEEQVDRYIEDPKCGFVPTTQQYVDMLSGVRVIQQLERVRAVRSDLPIYLFAGSEDPLSGRERVAELIAFYNQAGVSDIEHRIYEGARHETVNETNRDEVIADLVEWLDRQTTKLASSD